MQYLLLARDNSHIPPFVHLNLPSINVPNPPLIFAAYGRGGNYAPYGGGAYGGYGNYGGGYSQGQQYGGYGEWLALAPAANCSKERGKGCVVTVTLKMSVYHLPWDSGC